MTRVTSRSGQGSRGQSLTEFAVGMTILLILMTGVLDLGRAYFAFLSLRDAAQEGALYGSLAPTDLEGIRVRVRTSSGWPVDFAEFTDAQIGVSVHGPACAGSEIVVTLQMDFVLAAPFIGGKVLPLDAEAKDTVLQPAC